MNVTLKMINGEMQLKNQESEYNTKTAVGIGHYLTQKILRPEKRMKLLEHKCHGASFTTLENSEPSNAALTDVYTRRTDAFFRFMVVGRADCLPTPANLKRWYPNRAEENCKRCHENKKPTLAHILNECHVNFQLMTKRHNSLAKVVRKAVMKHRGGDLRSDIKENTVIGLEQLSDELRNLRPDMIFEGRTRNQKGEARSRGEQVNQENEERIIEILEFSCPYGRIAHERDTLEFTYNQKKTKYAEFAKAISEIEQKEVRVTAIIISSMGAVYEPSLKDLQKVLKCSDHEIRKIGKHMSETVIKGSLEIWRQDMKTRHKEREREEEQGQGQEEVQEVRALYRKYRRKRVMDGGGNTEPRNSAGRGLGDTEISRGAQEQIF
jgi:hypothetical protein